MKIKDDPKHKCLTSYYCIRFIELWLPNLDAIEWNLPSANYHDHLFWIHN